jgi:hypothetical protein
VKDLPANCVNHIFLFSLLFSCLRSVQFAKISYFCREEAPVVEPVVEAPTPVLGEPNGPDDCSAACHEEVKCS